jgi:hypothetical protein
VPELEELTSPFVSHNNTSPSFQKENVSFTTAGITSGVSPSTIAYLNEKANSKQQKHPSIIDNNNQSMNKVLRTMQSSELALPPILESQVVPILHHNKPSGPPSSANKSNSRVDSGIMVDMQPGGSNKTNWTLSTNGSEQDYDHPRMAAGRGNDNGTVITTIELVETAIGHPTVTGIIRKTTSAHPSTLNTYGRTSPSTQAKLTAAATPRKISIQIPATTITKQQLKTAINETKYVDICEKLNSLNEGGTNNYFINNGDKSNKRPAMDR